jgi:hypothetical protein
MRAALFGEVFQDALSSHPGQALTTHLAIRPVDKGE